MRKFNRNKAYNLGQGFKSILGAYKTTSKTFMWKIGKSMNVFPNLDTNCELQCHNIINSIKIQSHGTIFKFSIQNHWHQQII